MLPTQAPSPSVSPASWEDIANVPRSNETWSCSRKDTMCCTLDFCTHSSFALQSHPKGALADHTHPLLPSLPCSAQPLFYGSPVPPPSSFTPPPHTIPGRRCPLCFDISSKQQDDAGRAGPRGGGSLAGWSVGGCRNSRGTRQLSRLGLVPWVFALLPSASDITVSLQLLCLLDFSLSVAP